MRLYHASEGAGAGRERVLAEPVRVADTHLARARGLTFRRDHEGALLLRFDRVAPRTLHMVFVPFPVDAVWLVEGRVKRVARLRPWVGLASAPADDVVELPAGEAADVERGDRVWLA